MLAQRLPQFLGAQAGSPNWVTLIGTDDANAYDAYLADALELLGPNGQGLTQPGAAQNARIVDRLEMLARLQPRFARARAALAIAYLSLGGRIKRRSRNWRRAAPSARWRRTMKSLRHTQRWG